MGGAAKNRRAKKIKLQQVAQESKIITAFFNKQTKPEPIDAQLIQQPAVVLQLEKLIEEQEYSVDYPDDHDRSVSLNIEQPVPFTNEDDTNDTMDNMDVVPRSAVDVFIPTIEKQHMCDPVQLPTNAFQENYDISLSKNDELVQPEMLFPATNGRRFTSRHYKVYNWIEYSVSKDEIFCFSCLHFSANIIASGKTAGNLCFVNYGSKCKNWKEQTLSLNNHQRCKTHVICVQRWNDYLLVQKNHSLSIANQVNNVRQRNIIENREHLKFLLKAALFLSKQGLAFRGHNESDISKNKGNLLEI
ncbi:zinc finger MYM-type protein 5-like [Metopolophium dirhodum]|uniref:zinc finger MYM-type protein 5-like n=1 Tax=Metopolophium dirhodum TaxID=44670 RepID=UPI00298F517C|nr:zinc finger MYM-type protein 5-like [Metopolophium dirhodum]